jgi:16S rRNA (guanine966-N2)-methyltransferase
LSEVVSPAEISVRIISGEHKGRILSSVKKTGIRPSSDKVKGSIFNVLKDEVEGKRVLDLFAGSGSLGIEALSRGASFVTFVDSSSQSIKMIKRNLNSLNLGKRSDMLRKDCLKVLSNLKGKFGIIFADPPYLKGFAQQVIDSVVKYGLLDNDGILVLEHHKKETLECPDQKLSYIKAKRFGDTVASFFVKRD